MYVFMYLVVVKDELNTYSSCILTWDFTFKNCIKIFKMGRSKLRLFAFVAKRYFFPRYPLIKCI
jgi:hypothetical protein